MIQSKIESKRLEFGSDKCFKMQIGTNCMMCPQLKVHNGTMEENDTKKYLGDIITSDNKGNENIQMRVKKGIGINNQIMSILKEIPFGSFLL